MTTRHSGYVVTLAKDIREDDAEAVIAAMKMIKGVLTVKPVDGGVSQSIADQRARNELSTALWNVLYPENKTT